MDWTSRLARRLFASGAVAWAAALPAATRLAAQPAPSVAAYLSSAAIYGIGSVVCHQIPARSFHLWGRQMPVCARCLGIYAGAALVALAAIARVTPSRSVARRGPFRAMWWAALAGVPTAVTLLFEWVTGVAPSNTVRATAGFVLGATIAALVLDPGREQR